MMQEGNIIWLSSYPKSGNTWFRAFLSALLNETSDIDLNGLKTNGIFSSREIFDAFTDIDSRYLYNDEIKEIIPDVYQMFSEEVQKKQYIKIHDAYTKANTGKPIIPTAGTYKALYIIRNPLDIAASFANHMGSSIDHAIKVMNNPKGSLATQKNNLNTNLQIEQLILSWSLHVKSWVEHMAFPVTIIRYEDMLDNALSTFKKAVEFLALDISEQKLFQAIEAASFSRLQQKEIEKGFREKNIAAKIFFRSGKSGNWKNELTKEQAFSIIDHHSETMKDYGYDIDIEKYY